MTTITTTPEFTEVDTTKKSKKVPAIIAAVLLGIAAIGGTAAVVQSNQPFTSAADMTDIDPEAETFILAIEDMAQIDFDAAEEEGALWFGYGALTLMDMGMTEDEVVTGIVEEGATQEEAQAIVDLAQEHLTL